MVQLVPQSTLPGWVPLCLLVLPALPQLCSSGIGLLGSAECLFEMCSHELKSEINPVGLLASCGWEKWRLGEVIHGKRLVQSQAYGDSYLFESLLCFSFVYTNVTEESDIYHRRGIFSCDIFSNQSPPQSAATWKSSSWCGYIYTTWYLSVFF